MYRYNQIKPLIAEERISGDLVICKFKDPEGESMIFSSVSALEFQGTLRKFCSLIQSSRLWRFSLILFVRDPKQRRGYMSSRKAVLSQSEKEKAVEKAFEAVASQFQYLNGKWYWKHRIEENHEHDFR